MLTRFPLALDAEEGGLVMFLLDNGLEAISVDLSSSSNSFSCSSSFRMLPFLASTMPDCCVLLGGVFIMASRLFIGEEVS